MTEKYKRALQLEGRNQQWVSEKFKTSRQMVSMIINNTRTSKGYFGKSKMIKDYLEKLVKKYKL